uniref:Uncharacterized protein n=2 Tax=Leersia perrieri TaxID=77586 RepID=A0A0D9WRH4_9ORYZ
MLEFTSNSQSSPSLSSPLGVLQPAARTPVTAHGTARPGGAAGVRKQLNQLTSRQQEVSAASRLRSKLAAREPTFCPMADERITKPLATLPSAGADVLPHNNASPPSVTVENGAGRASRRPPSTTMVSPPPTAAAATSSLPQDEEGGSPAERRKKEEEELHNAKAKANLEAGGIAVVFAFAVLTAFLCLPSEAKHPSNTRFTVALLLAFATFVAGNCLMFLSMNMIGRRRLAVSAAHRGAARCLPVLSAALSTATLVSLLALLPGRIYLFVVGLAILAAVAIPLAAAHWYVTRRGRHGGDTATAAARGEYKEEMEAAWKTTTGVTNTAFGGLVGVLSGASKISGAAAAAAATYVAIFFMFSAAIIGMFAMTVSKRVLGVTNRKFQSLIVGAIRLTNAFLLCLLAAAALAASYVVLGLAMLAAFTPLVVTSVIFLLLRHCVPDRRHGGLTELEEARMKATEDVASKVTAATLGAIMSVLGGSLGEEDHRKAAWGMLDAVMVVLTSAFVSGFGFMLLAAVPAGSAARGRLAPVAKVLAWSSMAMFLATAVAVYGVESWRI